MATRKHRQVRLPIDAEVRLLLAAVPAFRAAYSTLSYGEMRRVLRYLAERFAGWSRGEAL